MHLLKLVAFGALTITASWFFSESAQVSLALQTLESKSAVTMPSLPSWQWLPPATPPVAIDPPIALESDKSTRRSLRRPKVHRGDEAVQPEVAMRYALRMAKVSLETCYERELRKQDSFSGFVVVALSVSADGSVTDGRVEEGNARDRRVGSCIVARLMQVKLPPLTDDADLVIPIRLEANEGTLAAR